MRPARNRGRVEMCYHGFDDPTTQKAAPTRLFYFVTSTKQGVDQMAIHSYHFCPHVGLANF
jgi:hypothetical protein